MMSVLRTLLAVALTGLLLTPAMAADWAASRVRGPVFLFVDNAWMPLDRGDVVPDGTVVRTGKGTKVRLERGNERIDLGSNTQIRIFDRDDTLYTTVKQDFGIVSIEADVRQVEHFAVETPQLAAVVKGTRFTVIYGQDIAEVRVNRGTVYVEDRRSGANTLVEAGQRASTASDGELLLDGESLSDDLDDEASSSLPEQANGVGRDGVPPGHANKASDGTAKGNSEAAKTKGNSEAAKAKGNSEAAKANGGVGEARGHAKNGKAGDAE